VRSAHDTTVPASDVRGAHPTAGRCLLLWLSLQIPEERPSGVDVAEIAGADRGLWWSRFCRRAVHRMPSGTLCGRPGWGKARRWLKPSGSRRTANAWRASPGGIATDGFSFGAVPRPVPPEDSAPLRAATQGAWRHPVDRPYDSEEPFRQAGRARSAPYGDAPLSGEAGERPHRGAWRHPVDRPYDSEEPFRQAGRARSAPYGGPPFLVNWPLGTLPWKSSKPSLPSPPLCRRPRLFRRRRRSTCWRSSRSSMRLRTCGAGWSGWPRWFAR